MNSLCPRYALLTLCWFCAAQSLVAAASDAGYSVNPGSREANRLFYQTVFASSSNVPGDWNGNIANCNAGTTSADYQAATLRRINWFRAMAGVPADISLNPDYNRKAQQAALMMSANNSLNQSPPASWACYSAEGAEGARNANLGLGQAGAEAIANGYIADTGSSNAAVGHRRWLLYPQTRAMGIGNVVPAAGGGVEASTVWVLDGNYGGVRPPVRDDFVAWPPKGYVPYTTVYPRWSFSYPAADFSGASLSMTENGVAIATRLEAPGHNIGEPTLVWLPAGLSDGMAWARPAADTLYSVQINNVQVGGRVLNFSYQVIVFDPDQPGPDSPNLTPQGSATLALGETANYRFAAGSATTDFQWRALPLAAQTLNDSAENGAGNFNVGISSGYSVVANGIAASGSNAFHLAHAQPQQQVLLLNQSLVASAAASLRFASRLGLSSPSQVALVEVSSDAGLSWTALYRQAGLQSDSLSSFGETRFTSQTVSLAAYANQIIQLRFRYALEGGNYYPQTSAGIGWYIDDIELIGVDQVLGSAVPNSISGNQFDYTAASGAAALLQVRAGLYGFFEPAWSAGLRIGIGGGGSTPFGFGSADCLLNWAERQFPALLTPPTFSTTNLAPLYGRAYADGRTVLGISSTDGHVYLVEAGLWSDLGHQSLWLAQAGCLQ